MKRRIILFLLSRFGRKKEQSGSGGKAAVGIGCLSAFYMGPFLVIFLFFAITANEDGLKERDFQEKEWAKAFLFPEVDYSESIQMLDCTIHARGYQ